jgi:hypothetical protein
LNPPEFPLLHHPQVHTVPSSFSAKLCCSPPDTPTTLLRPLTFTGLVRKLLVVPSPSCE